MSNLKRAIGWVTRLMWARTSKEREPFWSVSKGVRNQFFIILSGFWIASLALSIYLTLNCVEGAEEVCNSGKSIPSAMYGVLETFSKIALGATVAAAMVTPPLVFTGDLMMGIYEAISERWGKIATERRLAEAIEKARAEAAAESRALGYEEGVAEGVAQERARWEAQQQRPEDGERQQNQETGDGRK